MSLSIKDLEAHVSSLREQIDGLQEELHAAQLLMEKLKAREPASARGTKYRHPTVAAATKDFFENGQHGEWFTVEDVVRELRNGGLDYEINSLVANVGSTLKSLTDKGFLVRRNISKTNIVRYTYSVKR